MVNSPLKFPLYSNIVFKPNNVDGKRNDLNIWPGFKAQEVSVVDMDIVNAFINHIQKVWASDDEGHYNYIMSWLAQVIKTPEKMTEAAILLTGGQGTGKTLPCDILLQRVFVAERVKIWTFPSGSFSRFPRVSIGFSLETNGLRLVPPLGNLLK